MMNIADLIQNISDDIDLGNLETPDDVKKTVEHYGWTFGDFMIAINKLYDDITIIYDFFGDDEDYDEDDDMED